MDNGWLLYLPGFLPLDAGVACFAQSRSPGYKLPITAVTDTGAGAGEGGGTGQECWIVMFGLLTADPGNINNVQGNVLEK